MYKTKIRMLIFVLAREIDRERRNRNATMELFVWRESNVRKREEEQERERNSTIWWNKLLDRSCSDFAGSQLERVESPESFYSLISLEILCAPYTERKEQQTFYSIDSI